MNQPTGNLGLLLNVLPQVEGLVEGPPAALPETKQRAFLFLQGPPGPLLHQLAEAMRARGIAVERINICAGDEID